MAKLPSWVLDLALGKNVIVAETPTPMPMPMPTVFTISSGFATLGNPTHWNKPVADAIIQEKLSGVSESDCLTKGIAWAEGNGDFTYANEMARKVKSIYANENFKAQPTLFVSFPVDENAQTPNAQASNGGDNPERENSCDDDAETSNAQTLHVDAYHGLFGEMLSAIEPELESTSASVLLGWLTCFGNIVGRNAYFTVKGNRHYPTLYVAVVGGTADGKGEAWSVSVKPFNVIASVWASERIKGVGSGEGLLEQIQDTDENTNDKRLMVRLSELSRALKLGRREGSTLSEIIREAWDGNPLSITNRSANALTSTGYSVSIVGDITPNVLRNMLSKGSEAFDGWANRFLWSLIENVRDIPDGGNIDVLTPFFGRLQDAINHAQGVGEMKRDADADTLWRSVYGELKRSGERVPHTDRARPYVMRIAMLYALADCSKTINVEHLKAALAVWRFCEASAKSIFGNASASSETPLSVKLLNAIVERPGISRFEIRELLGTRVKASDIGVELQSLKAQRLAYDVYTVGVGRPVERWYPGVPTDDGNGTTIPSSEIDEGVLITSGIFTMGGDESGKETNKVAPDVSGCECQLDGDDLPGSEVGKESKSPTGEGDRLSFLPDFPSHENGNVAGDGGLTLFPSHVAATDANGSTPNVPEPAKEGICCTAPAPAQSPTPNEPVVSVSYSQDVYADAEHYGIHVSDVEFFRELRDLDVMAL